MCANDTSNRASATGGSPFFGDICLLGLGVTGQATADYFVAHPESFNSLTIYPGALQKDKLEYLNTLPEYVKVFADEMQVTGSYDLAIASPGIAPHNEFYLSAAKAAKEIISEPELAWRISPQNWVAVTGTNGKTTVTELITALLKSAGMQAWAAGNIGTPCIEAICSRQEGDFIVAELSSYQLHSISQLSPDAAVLLNITPDHLSWHITHEQYCDAKLRLLSNMAPEKTAVVDCSSQCTLDIANTLTLEGRRIIRIGDINGPAFDSAALKTSEALADVGYVDAATHKLILKLNNATRELLTQEELLIRGPHNASNALASAAVAAELGATTDAINEALKSFTALSHRFEPCGEIDNIFFIDDSKATNTDAAIKALTTFCNEADKGSVVALFGGRDKDTHLSELVDVCEKACRYAVCYGEAGKRFFEALSKKVPAILEGTFDSAFKRACELAEPGDTVLLSPACASFDEFTSFEARGDYFKTKVAALRGEAS